MSYKLTRRQTIAAMSAMAILPACSIGNNSRQLNASFSHGVASGDPDNSSFVIWTRVNTKQRVVSVDWEVAADKGFKQIVAKGTMSTTADRDFTVKVLVDKLASGQRFFYRFKHGDQLSPIGRSQTLPQEAIDKLGIAVASCSNYPFGYFNAYDAIAKDEDVDVVLHLGDYIYEYEADGWGGDVGQTIDRLHVPSNEIVSLNDYRQRHAQYKSDQGSQRMHAAHPLIAIWDDHETTNNPWMKGAQNHQPDQEGDWYLRRAASLQAYFEWMPIREPAMGTTYKQYWRHFKFGDLASVISLETRHTGRSEQIDYQQYLPKIGSQAERDAFVKDVLGDASRTMLSAPMEAFLETALNEATTSKRPWKIVANQIPMARTHVPKLEHPLFGAIIEDKTSPLAAEWAAAARLGELDLPIYTDTWDGYPVARERFYKLCEQAGANDLLVLTGDSHAFWQNQLFDQSGKAVGLELGTSGISSPGDFLRLGQETSDLLDQLVAEKNHEVVWTDNRYNGYIRLVLTHDKARADYIGVSTVLSPNYSTSVIRTVDIANNGSTLAYV